MDPPAIYVAANTVSEKTAAILPHKLGVCRAINSEVGIYPTGSAKTYLAHYMHQNFDFNQYPDGSPRTDTSVRIVKRPMHGRLVQEYPDATNYEKFNYKYIPDVDYGDFDHFVMEAKAGGITVRIYYTMSVGLPGEPTYAFSENGEKIDDLSRCARPYWKISQVLYDSPSKAV